MPELPEVETMRLGLLSLVGGAITQVLAPPCTCRPISMRPSLEVLSSRLCGRTITQVLRAGKRLVFVASGDEHLVLEPRMTGLALLADPPDRDHLRLQIETTAGRLLFWDRRGLGVVRLFSGAEWRRFLNSGVLGPDALEMDAKMLQGRLGTSNRAIKAALLDQSAVAGVGNIYASELLHVARIHPGMPCRKIAPSQWQDITQAMHDVLRKAIAHEGSTLSDGTFRNTLNQFGGYQNHHVVYDREGETCTSCQQGSVERVVLAQRSTFFCPVCQSDSAANHRTSDSSARHRPMDGKSPLPSAAEAGNEGGDATARNLSKALRPVRASRAGQGGPRKANAKSQIASRAKRPPNRQRPLS